jgi:hypothetical protein
LGEKFVIDNIQECPPTVRNKKIIEKRRKMPVFHCYCGSKILVLPDIAAMNKAIKNHLIAHEKLTGKCLAEETLTQEILKVVSKG